MRKVCYLYNPDFTKFILSEQHPMKPMRLKMVHSLINNYSLTSQLHMFQSKVASPEDICLFHHPQYVKYLETWVSPKTSSIVDSYDISTEDQRNMFEEDRKLGEIFKINQGFDCPGFEGLFHYCQLSAGSSIDAAHLIIAGEGDIAINWMGGFHHARKTSASGFCYINDIVLCILELLKVYQRVLYLDIDVHHGDGVEEAFLHTNRVMTVSFHQFQSNFFPQTGSLESVGEGEGKYFTVNVPLKKGIDNISYVNLFKRVMDRVMNSYRPEVVVVQCGADSLSKDRLGDLHLSISGHGECLEHMKSFGVPLVLLGGGGYTIENVARCWTYETGLMLGHQIDNNIPPNDQFSYYYTKDDNKIHFEVEKKTVNTNSSIYLNSIEERIAENLRNSDSRPSVGFHLPPKVFVVEERRERMTEEEREHYFPNS